MAHLSEQHTERYAGVWASLPGYRDHSPGVEVLPVFLDAIGYDGWPEGWQASVLDAGCGSGKAGLALAEAGFRVTLCDLTDEGLDAEDTPAIARLPFVPACLWRPLRPQVRLGQVDYVFCADVMEHLPPQFTMLAVDQMLALAERGVFLAVSLVPDQAGAWVGVPLHETVQSFVWWRDSLREIAEVVDARDMIIRGTFYLRRRTA